MAVEILCPDFGKFNVEDTKKCAPFNKETGKINLCPIIESCSIKAGLHG